MSREVRIAIGAAVGAVVLLALVAVSIAFGQDVPAGTVATVGVDPPTDGTHVLLTCNTIASVELTTANTPPYTMQTRWATVKGSQRAEPCPATQEHPNAFAFTTEPRRNYIVSVRVRVYAADGSLISDRYPPPYYYFENGLAKPSAPVMHRTLSASRGPNPTDNRLHGRVTTPDPIPVLLPWELIGTSFYSSTSWGGSLGGNAAEALALERYPRGAVPEHFPLAVEVAPVAPGWFKR